MKFIVERDALSAALATATSGHKKNAQIPILNNVLLDAKDSRVRLLVHNIDDCCEVDCAAEVEIAGDLTAPIDGLAGLLGSMTEGAQVVFEGEPDRLTVKAGRGKFRLPTLAASDYPTSLPCEPTDRLDLTPAEVSRLFKDTAHGAGNNASRAYSCGIFLHNAKGKAVSAATTDHLNLLRASVEALKTIKTPIIIHSDIAKQIVRLSKDGPLTVEWSKNTIRISSGSMRLTSKLIDAQFPDYENLLLSNLQDRHLKFDRRELLAAVRRIGYVAPEGATMQLSWEDEAQVMTLSLTDLGREEVECDCVGMPSGDVKASPGMFGDLLDAVDGEIIGFHIENNGAMIRLSKPEQPSFIALQAPRVA